MRTRLNRHLLEHVIGPTFRLVLIGASEVSRYLAPIAATLGMRIDVVDPRHECMSTWPHAGCQLHEVMPEDFLLGDPPNVRTVVVALSHDPKLDDLALMEALKSPVFTWGPWGQLELPQQGRSGSHCLISTPDHLAQLHGPVGADIGARTPPEIAVSIAADLVTAIRRAG